MTNEQLFDHFRTARKAHRSGWSKQGPNGHSGARTGPRESVVCPTCHQSVYRSDMRDDGWCQFCVAAEKRDNQENERETLAAIQRQENVL